MLFCLLGIFFSFYVMDSLVNVSSSQRSLTGIAVSVGILFGFFVLVVISDPQICSLGIVSQHWTLP